MLGGMKVKFLKSAWQPTEYPFASRPEVAVVGRSNAGKSSFINALTGQRIAKVSQTPGKTRLLNFFDLDESVYMVDMPGYGFATGNRREVEGWRSMVEAYLSGRESLRGVLLIMDIRRDWQEEEEMLKNWFNSRNLAWAVVLNKADKLSRSNVLKRVRELQQSTGSNVPLFALSAAKKTGFDEVQKLIFKEWSRKLEAVK